VYLLQIHPQKPTLAYRTDSQPNIKTAVAKTQLAKGSKDTIGGKSQTYLPLISSSPLCDFSQLVVTTAFK